MTQAQTSSEPPKPARVDDSVAARGQSVEATILDDLRCPRCDASGTQLGQVCRKHDLFLVPRQSLEGAPEGNILGELLVGRYIILGVLGSGAVGTVYWGVQHPIGRRVAIKVLHSGLTGDREDEERFLREAQAIATLNHPHVVTCYDYGFTERHRAYMAIEFLMGNTLESVLAHDELGVEQVIYVAQQMLEGVAAMHDAALIHRDLKPANMMLCQVGRSTSFLKIIDFGLVRGRPGKDGEKLTQAGHILGTPVYMAPEQALGSTNVTAATDVYALGCILYEMIEGAPPFDGKNVMDIMLSHVRKEVPPLDSARASRFPGELRDFVLRCLEKEPEERLANGGQALRAFAQLGLPKSGPEVMESVGAALLLPDEQSESSNTGLTLNPTIRVDVDEAFIQHKRTSSVLPEDEDLEQIGLARQWLDLVWTTARTVVRLIVGIVASIPLWDWIAQRGQGWLEERSLRAPDPDQSLAARLNRSRWGQILVGFPLFALLYAASALLRGVSWVGTQTIAALTFVGAQARVLAESARNVDKREVRRVVERYAILAVPIGLARIIGRHLFDFFAAALSAANKALAAAREVHDALGRKLLLDIDTAVARKEARVRWRSLRGKVAPHVGSVLLLGNVSFLVLPPLAVGLWFVIF